MREDFLTVDIGSIANTKKMMDSYYNVLISMMNKYKTMINETKNIYDTESAMVYRRVVNSYIEIVERYLINEFKPYIDKLDEIKNVYIDEYKAISKSIQGVLNEKSISR